MGVAVADVDEIWFCYLLQCRDGSFYVGVAVDPEERLKKHNWGVGARFTAMRRPVTLVWMERHRSQRAARGREAELKGWSRAKKLELVAKFQRGIHPSPKDGSG